ncbi:glycosyltransferase [Saccharolobus islandicus]|uniref:Glycosyl transferase family 2 n=1 Tax=Saccharolobus islandicus (strain M.14.25 / Kamchatka \|nr:glycosyltransferase [Sulfolobus islandicus]ACP37773.1 glycosyl transferase family 2 [Sulfolobus islandicus M.14.25]
MLVTIVTYNPDVNFVSNMIKTIREKDNRCKILVVDNHSRLLLQRVKEIADYFIEFNKNYGLGKAYNYAIRFAKELEEEYIMFLDQDTTILRNFAPNKVIHEAKELKKNSVEPVILSVNIDNALIERKIPNSNFYIAKEIPNSGMILNVNYAIKNPFLEELFLDRLDNEYSYRAKKLGYLPLSYNERMILHKPGECSKFYSTLCGKLLMIILLILHRNEKNIEKYKQYFYYSNFLRYYLMLRNDIYLWLRRKIYPSFWKMIISDLIIICEVLGYKNGIRWVLRAIKYGVIGDLEKDNKELFKI